MRAKAHAPHGEVEPSEGASGTHLERQRRSPLEFRTAACQLPNIVRRVAGSGNAQSDVRHGGLLGVSALASGAGRQNRRCGSALDLTLPEGDRDTGFDGKICCYPGKVQMGFERDFACGWEQVSSGRGTVMQGGGPLEAQGTQEDRE